MIGVACPSPATPGGFGYVLVVQGVLIQEAIDVAVILNAPRVLRKSFGVSSGEGRDRSFASEREKGRGGLRRGDVESCKFGIYAF